MRGDGHGACARRRRGDVQRRPTAAAAGGGGGGGGGGESEGAPSAQGRSPRESRSSARVRRMPSMAREEVRSLEGRRREEAGSPKRWREGVRGGRAGGDRGGEWAAWEQGLCAGRREFWEEGGSEGAVGGRGGGGLQNRERTGVDHQGGSWATGTTFSPFAGWYSAGGLRGWDRGGAGRRGAECRFAAVGIAGAVGPDARGERAAERVKAVIGRLTARRGRWEALGRGGICEPSEELRVQEALLLADAIDAGDLRRGHWTGRRSVHCATTRGEMSESAEVHGRQSV